MVDGDFENSQPGARSFHLHLEVPTVCLLAHPELFERNTSDRAKRTHVRVANTVKDGYQPTGKSAGEDLLEVHASRFALPAGPRADDKILRASNDWIDQLRHKFRAIAAVTVEKHNGLAFRPNGRHTRSTSAAITARRFCHTGTGFPRALCRLIGTSVVDNDDLVRNFCAGDLANDVGYRFFLVQCRDDNRHVAHRSTIDALVK